MAGMLYNILAAGYRKLQILMRLTRVVESTSLSKLRCNTVSFMLDCLSISHDEERDNPAAASSTAMHFVDPGVHLAIERCCVVS